MEQQIFMWTKNFADAIFNSLEAIQGEHLANYFKAFHNGIPYFVKRFNISSYENLYTAKDRIEKTEQINMHFYKSGINTVTAVSNGGSFTHCNLDGLWAAYPWISATAILQVDTALCYNVGRLLGRMHNISAPFYYQNELIAYRKSDFSWETHLNNIPEEALIQFQRDIVELEKYDSWGYECAQKLLENDMSVLSHGDLHCGNLLLYNNEFVLIDWELSGSTNPEIELFDAALNFCGFCVGKSNLQYFESFVRGYYDVYHPIESVHQIEYARGTLFLLIIEHMSNELNRFIATNEFRYLEQAKKFKKQFDELKKYGQTFQNIIENYASRANI